MVKPDRLHLDHEMPRMLGTKANSPLMHLEEGEARVDPDSLHLDYEERIERARREGTARRCGFLVCG
eukprot:61601-Prorocentrum_minimum.AAC.1